MFERKFLGSGQQLSKIRGIKEIGIYGLSLSNLTPFCYYQGKTLSEDERLPMTLSSLLYHKRLLHLSTIKW